jgi:hypothetical protein
LPDTIGAVPNHGLASKCAEVGSNSHIEGR